MEIKLVRKYSAFLYELLVRHMINLKHKLMIRIGKKSRRQSNLPNKIIKNIAQIRSIFNALFEPEYYMQRFHEILWFRKISHASLFSIIEKIKAMIFVNHSSSIAIDSTVFKTTIRGDWRSNEWLKKRNRCIKQHVLVVT